MNVQTPTSGSRGAAPPRAAIAIVLLLCAAAPAWSQTAPDTASIATATEATASGGDSASVDAATPAAPATANPHPRLELRKVRIESGSHNVVRSGPGDAFAIVGVYPQGTVFPVIAKKGRWYSVRLSPTESGWIHASLVREFEDLSDLEFRPNPRLYSRIGAYSLSGYAGAYAFDRKSNSLVLGGRLAYYVFDRLQAEAGVGWTHVRRPAEIVESLFGLSLEAEDFHMLFYHLNLTWELMPGRQMVPFVSAGVGSAIMQGETEASLNFGAGTTLFLSKRTAMRWEVREHRFESGSDDARLVNHNIEFTLGSVLLF